MVTVGLCVKNGAETIQTAIKSLCSQTYPSKDTEVLVVDGKSRDDTIQIIKDNLTCSYGSVRFLQETGGLGTARQMVVEKAGGKYIVWLDADMSLVPDYIEKQVAYMEQHPNVAIAGGKYSVHIGYGLAADLENIVYAVDSTFGQHAKASKYGYLPGAEGAIYRTAAVRAVGGFDTKINGAAEDTEMAYRVRAKGWELATTDEKFTESTRASWQSLWKQYVWYGRGGHYIFHKDPASLSLMKMSPVGGFIAGILRSPGAYLLTHHTSFFLLPVHYTYKRFAWLFGFFTAHLSGYGHNIN
jgi:glycosyltransferase involved in cell wall biosynthesis